MKIKHENGMVTFKMRTGKTFVRSQMTIGSANRIVTTGKDVVEKDSQIIVDDKYFFPVADTPKRKKKTEDENE